MEICHRKRKWGPKMLKNHVFLWKTRAFWQKVAEFCHRKRKWGPKMLKNHVFWKKRALSGKKLRNFATGNGNGVQNCSKTMFFWKKNARFLAKSLKFTRFITPKPEIKGFYCVFKWQYFQISSKLSKIFFFRSKNPENLRGFCPPNRKWHSYKAFIAFLSDNIFNFEAK